MANAKDAGTAGTYRKKIKIDEKAAAERLTNAWLNFIANPQEAINNAANSVKEGVKNLADTAKKNGYGPKTTANYVKEEPGRKGQPTSNITATLKTRPAGYAMEKGKPVKRDANAPKDTVAAKKRTITEPSRTAQATNYTGTKKPTANAPAFPQNIDNTQLRSSGAKNAGKAAPSNKPAAPQTSKKDAPTAKTSAAPTASTGKGFLSKTKAHLTAKDRINAALAWTGSKGGKTTTVPAAKDAPGGKTTTAPKTQSKADKKQKTKKQQAAQVKAETVSEPFNATEAMRARRAAAEAAGKGKFNATEEMKKRRAAAEAAGKGKFNATEEMKKRRAAAEAQGKGKWNAQEEMRKRREEAARRKIQKGFNGK